MLFDAHAASAWLEQFAATGIPAAPINTVEEAVNDAQTLARNMIVQLEHPALGLARSIGNPIKFSETPVSYRLPPPLLGEHTREVLRGFGYSEEEVARCRRRRSDAAPPKQSLAPLAYETSTSLR